MEGQSLHSTLIGSTIGNYRVVAKLGEGGMGAVYLAEHPQIGKKVALKVLHDEYSSNQEVVTRFFNEARAVNEIGHPNIVDIIDYGHVQAGYGANFVYFIMEFLQGEALASLLAREAPLEPARALHIAMQVADALAASHAKGIVHRDLKPDNVYLIPRGRERDFVKLLDFGIAKLTGDHPGGSKRTRTGIVMGTPAYMSPEQCEGRGNIDHRTDVYAMGILLYEMITGRVPFAGEGYGEVLVQHLTRAPARPSTIRGVIPPAVEAIVMKALEKRREDRYQNMEEFMQALRDPDAYVEAMGGLGAFYNLSPAQSMPTMALTPGAGGGSTMAGGYPVYPGSQPGHLPLPPQPTMSGVPRPQSAVAGQVVPGPSRRLPVIVGSAAIVLLLIGGGLFLLGNRQPAPPTPTDVPQEPAVTPEEPKPEQPKPEQPKPEQPKPEQPKPDQPAGNPEQPKPDQPKPDQPKPEQPKPEEPKQVTIKVVSVPTGADVFVGDEKDSRGKTPLELKLAKGEGESTLTLKLDGYKPKTKPVKLTANAELEIRLDKDKGTTSHVRPDKPKPDKPKPDKPKPDKPKTNPVDDDDVLEPTF